MRKLGIAALLLLFALLIATPLTFAEKDRASLKPPKKVEDKKPDQGESSIEKMVFENIPEGFPLQLRWPFFSAKLGKAVNVWYVPRAEYFIDANTMAMIDGNYYVQTEKNILCSISENGALQWTTSLRFRISHAPQVTALALYLANLSNIICLDRRSGQMQWTKEYELAFTTAPHVTPTTLFIGTTNKLIVAIDRLTGNINWNTAMDGDIVAAPTDCFRPRPADYVLAPCIDGHIYAFNTVGKTLWRFKTYGMLLSTPVAETVGEERYIYFGSQDTNLYCVNAISSQKTWEYRCGYSISESPIIVGKNVYFRHDRGTFNALDKTIGKLLWKSDKYTGVVGTSTGNLYCVSGKNVVSAVNPANGTESWSFELKSFDKFISNPADGNVIGLTKNGLVLVFSEAVK
jgi:outer membrane protein assembly factor BamB